ncbi:MAG: DUF3267 domain-containing protein [Clostridia bacterium]|nr:DUF3267 domain-containing protein [Clostridia bacterium]
MRKYAVLTDEYKKLFSLDLAQDKKALLEVNVLSFAICIVMFAAGQRFVSLEYLVEGSDHGISKFLVLAAGSILYIVLHEWAHGVFMRIFSDEPVKYGFKGVYFFAGSDAYFYKLPYLVIALAPLVIWGVVFGALCFAVPKQWFWVFYFLQIFNVSGAAGDLYVVFKFSYLPKDAIIHDSGVSMEVYGKPKN